MKTQYLPREPNSKSCETTTVTVAAQVTGVTQKSEISKISERK